jgi:hypothetical protein
MDCRGARKNGRLAMTGDWQRDPGCKAVIANEVKQSMIAGVLSSGSFMPSGRNGA